MIFDPSRAHLFAREQALLRSGALAQLPLRELPVLQLLPEPFEKPPLLLLLRDVRKNCRMTTPFRVR
jgi:hypothetical protein